MTDKEIIKALECCKVAPQNCGDCPMLKMECQQGLPTVVLGLINRQQETIETLRNCVKQHHIIRQDDKSPLSLLVAEIKAEAIKEFAERLKERRGVNFPFTRTVFVEDIDNLVKEMVGEE